MDADSAELLDKELMDELKVPGKFIFTYKIILACKFQIANLKI